MRRIWLFVVLFGGLLVVLGASALIGWRAGDAKAGAFDWGLASVVLTGLGTTALALATAGLAASTWQDVRASQRTARAAIEANELVKTEQARRPVLTIEEDSARIHWRVEGDACGWVRLVVRNAEGRRAAHGTRVLVEQCEMVGHPRTRMTLGSPSLGWPSAPEAEQTGAVVVFAGSSRPLNFGKLMQFENLETDEWRFKLALHNLAITDRREYLDPGTWIVRLVVGSDEADAHAYDVRVAWDENAVGPQQALDSVSLSVQPTEP